MRRYILLVVCLCLVSLLHAQNRLELVSPNGELKVSLNLSDKIYYSIDYNGDVLLKDNSLLLVLKNQVLGQNPKLRRQKQWNIDEQLTPIVPLKLLLSGKKRQNHIFSTNIISYTCFTKKGLSFEAM